MASVTVTTAASPATVTGLGAGTWSFTVTALDANGPGPASAPSRTVAIAAGAGVLTVDRGAWSSTSTYAWDDSVTAGGQTWYCVCRTGVLGVAPGTDRTRWGAAVS